MTEHTPMETEFDTVARWIEDVVSDLGPEHAVPAGCRGSASPAGLDRLCDPLRPGMWLGDVGGGTGGPAAYAAEHAGVAPVVVDPMPGACRAAARLFGLDTVVGDGERVPLATGSLDACWCLGVLCTVEGKAGLVRELRRVLTPGGPLGVLVFTADEPRPPGAPEGNRFPTLEGVRTLLRDNGFVIEDEIAPGDLPPAPPSWTQRADRVHEMLTRRHGADPRFAEAEEQSGRLSALMADGVVRGHLLRAR